MHPLVPAAYDCRVRLHFYGTKGYVEESSADHAGHSAFTVEAEGFRLLCDFGENRRGLLAKIQPDAIFVSHAHPDHAWGLEEGTAAPVHASAITHELTAKMPVETRIVLEPGQPVRAGPFRRRDSVSPVLCGCFPAEPCSRRVAILAVWKSCST